MIHFFLGTKAQLIKMGPVIREVQDRGIPFNFIWTGQHRETIDDLRDNFGIRAPDRVLLDGDDVTSVLQMAAWSARILYQSLVQRRSMWQGDRGGVVVVHGDTFSTLLGALAARISGHRCAHVEAGLRSFNLRDPFPEELTRVVVFKLAHLLYAPGAWAVANLERERGETIDTGANTLVDALAMIVDRPTTAVAIPDVPFVVASIHRFENIFKRSKLEGIIDSLIEASSTIRVLFILHLPTRKRLEGYNLLKKLEDAPNIELRPRYDYAAFIKLISSADAIVTDGGSNQEECSYLGLPCFIMRKGTERQEGLDQNVVLGAFEEGALTRFLAQCDTLRRPRQQLNKRPTQILVDHLASHA